jgi:hypothetical protein
MKKYAIFLLQISWQEIQGVSQVDGNTTGVQKIDAMKAGM